MARYNGPVCRLCRRDGLKLFLKGSRCDTPKCAIERRDVPPGMNNARRGKLTDYGVQLREKQKLKHYFGVLERQFRGYFQRASRTKGNTGNTLLSLLERRLDNVVHRLGFGQSRAQARQLIAHGHITVNGKFVNIPSYSLRVGDVIRVKNRAKSLQLVQANMSQRRGAVPDYVAAGANAVDRRIVLAINAEFSLALTIGIAYSIVLPVRRV
jgi:small subunit ribosomal protein S4